MTEYMGSYTLFEKLWKNNKYTERKKEKISGLICALLATVIAFGVE